MDNAIVTVVPDFSGAGSNNAPLNDLKGKCDAARALGLVRCEGSELLVVYDSTFLLPSHTPFLLPQF